MSAEDRSDPTQRRDPLFNVVHDPLTDRFFLQEVEQHGADARAKVKQAVRKSDGRATEASVSFPWERVVLPPRSVSKSKAATRTVVTDAASAPSTETTEPPSSHSVTPVASVAANSTEMDARTSTATPGTKSLRVDTNKPPTALSVPSPRRTTRRSNNRSPKMTKLSSDMAALLSNLPELDNGSESLQTAIKWRGEPLSVRVAGLAPADPHTNNECRQDDLDPCITSHLNRTLELDHGQWLAHTFDLQQLARIRPSADGFRSVNIGCSFPSMDPWSSSSESDAAENEEEDEEASSSDESALPVFQRGDRVRFRLSGSLREMTGRVVARIHRSVFYDVQGADGRVLKSVYAGNIALQPAKEPKPRRKPRHCFGKHDRVLWLPPRGEEDASFDVTTNNSDSTDRATYKARVVQVRSFDRFDLLLRTGRLVKRVPYDQLRPRDSF